MYEDLIQELRHGEFALSTSISRRQLMDKAANAIEILSKHDAEVDKIARQSCEVRAALGCATMDELLELARDGRVLVLPCPIGTEVFRVATLLCKNRDERCEKICEGWPYSFCLNFERDLQIIHYPFSLADMEDFGKTVFLTEDAAMAALKEMEGST